MAVDYLSAMNVGSGLNVTQIVDALVDAEKAPREAQINAKIEEKTVSISALAEVKQEFSALSTNLTALSQVSAIQLQTTGSSGASTAIAATVNNPALLTTFDHNIVVNTLAQPQTISFSGYSTETAALDASALTIDLGTWSVDSSGNYSFANNDAVGSSSISLDNTDTIATLRDKINNLGLGVSASIIKISDTDYGLTLTSKLGTENQVRIQATSTSGAISNLSFDPATNGSGAANGGDAQKQVTNATDASIDFNGVTVTRSSNQLTDLIPGVTIDLNTVSSSKERIQAAYDEEISLAAMQIFVSELNTITNNLIEKTKTSTTEDSGPLVGDTLMRAYKSSLRKITTTPISGYGTDDIYLSNFGVMTNQNGTITLDETKFKSYFAAKPEQFAALTTSNVTTSSLSVTAQMTGSLWKPGVYTFNSVVRSATTVLSANEATSQTFKSIDSSFGAGDGELSDSLEAYVAANAGGTWSITGTDSSLVSIDSNGVVTVNGGTDYETKSSYSFSVEYTISASEKFSETVTLNINDLAERKYTLTSPHVPTTVSAGDSFSVTVDGHIITTSNIASGGDNSYTLTKLVTALNLANNSADGSFSEDAGNLVFTYNDAATVQTSALTSGLVYNSAATLGTVSENTAGAVTARSVRFAQKSDIATAISNAVATDIFKINIQLGGSSYDVSHTIDSDDVTAIGAMTSASEKANYLANKLDIAAGTAASGLDVGIDFAQSSGYLVGTATISGTAYNAATISQLQYSDDSGSSYSNLGSANVNTPGTSTAEIVKVASPTVPTIAAGDKFSITLDNNGSALTVTTAALSVGDDLNAIKDALNTAHNNANGTFSVSGSDLLFTYNENTGPVSNSNDTGLVFIPAPGTIVQTAAGVDHPVASTVTEVSHVAGDAEATLGSIAMSLENGVYKITSGDAIGVQISASGNQSASIYIGKSLSQSVTDFANGVLDTNGDIDEKVSRYNLDIDAFNEQLTTLETRMENERQRYVEQFTAMETAVSGFKETSSILDNLMESWKAGLS